MLVIHNDTIDFAVDVDVAVDAHTDVDVDALFLLNN